MADKATIWAIILGLTYLIMSIAAFVEDPNVRGFAIAAIFIFITTALSKQQ